MNLSRLVLVSSLLVCSQLLWAQSEQPFSSLEERMTGREFTESGLHKLNPEELAALNRWIRERSVAEYEGPTESEIETGSEATTRGQADEASSIDSMPRERFKSRLVGEFTGWSGNTVFRLDNGMVWKQNKSDSFRTKRIESPMVTIRPGLLGSWWLSVEGFNSSTRVERIE